MIVILCDSFLDVRDAFDQFIYFLSLEFPYAIRTIYEKSYGVLLEDDLTYVFLDYHLQQSFRESVPNAEFTDQYSFFEAVLEYFYGPGADMI